MLTLAASTATNPLLITPVGVVIAVLFLVCIVGVLGWMLRLPKETEHTLTATRAMRSVNKLTRVMVPLLHPTQVTDRIVALAGQMAHQRRGIIELLTVVEVPLMLPLDAAIGEDEQHALALLDRASSIIQQRNLVGAASIQRRMVKARHAGPAIVREAAMQAADVIIVSNSPVRVRGNLQAIDPAVQYVMEHAPCEVLVLSQGPDRKSVV